jgi:hypothetical protein
MRKLLLVILTASFLAHCTSSHDKTISGSDRLELPEPDKDQRIRQEAFKKLRLSGCQFSNPDTSLSGIKLRNIESAASILDESDKTDSLGQYRFYSKMDRETLILTQLPGDGKHQISIFRVEFSDKADYGYRQIPVDTFKTGKGIKLGMTKKDIVDRLGSCYAALDSTNGYIELYYRIETPNDSKTRILNSNNMPVYYASYKLWKDRLENFEFGFEYP